MVESNQLKEVDSKDMTTFGKALGKFASLWLILAGTCLQIKYICTVYSGFCKKKAMKVNKEDDKKAMATQTDNPYILRMSDLKREADNEFFYNIRCCPFRTCAIKMTTRWESMGVVWFSLIHVLF